MPDTAIAAQVHQPLDVHRSFAAEVALDRETRNGGPELRHFRLRQVLDRGLWCNARCLANLFRARIADSENRRQRETICLFSGIFMPAIRATVSIPSLLTLTLLVTRVSTNHPNNAVTTDDLAIPADFLNGCSYFHELSPRSLWLNVTGRPCRSCAGWPSASCPRTDGSWHAPASAT